MIFLLKGMTMMVSEVLIIALKDGDREAMARLCTGISCWSELIRIFVTEFTGIFQGKKFEVFRCSGFFLTNALFIVAPQLHLGYLRVGTGNSGCCKFPSVWRPQLERFVFDWQSTVVVELMKLIQIFTHRREEAKWQLNLSTNQLNIFVSSTGCPNVFRDFSIYF